jgi:hypothetical protein
VTCGDVCAAAREQAAEAGGYDGEPAAGRRNAAR